MQRNQNQKKSKDERNKGSSSSWYSSGASNRIQPSVLGITHGNKGKSYKTSYDRQPREMTKEQYHQKNYVKPMKTYDRYRSEIVKL